MRGQVSMQHMVGLSEIRDATERKSQVGDNELMTTCSDGVEGP